MKFTYLILDVLTISIPLLRSFETEKVKFSQKWYALFPAIFLVGIIFIIWDVWFTSMGVWGFNDDYITGIRLFHLPLEEWGFFLVVPYACVFIYEVLNFFIKKDILKPFENIITIVLAACLLVIGLLNLDKYYTSITFIGTGLYLLSLFFVFKPKWLSRFYFSYTFVLIPFFIMNGILTYLPVVWYNNEENLGIRLGSIPVEDVFYGFLLLLLVVHLYEILKIKFAKSQ